MRGEKDCQAFSQSPILTVNKPVAFWLCQSLYSMSGTQVPGVSEEPRRYGFKVHEAMGLTFVCPHLKRSLL